MHSCRSRVRASIMQVKQRELAFAAEGDADGGRNSCTDFLRQMGYREYSRYLSFHFPFTHERSLLEHLRACPWRFDQRLFKVRLPSAYHKSISKSNLLQSASELLWSLQCLATLRLYCGRDVSPLTQLKSI